MAFTEKQKNIIHDLNNREWFMLINHGAKRSGKTYLDNMLFIQELNRVKKTADELGIANPQYILAGYTLGNIRQNIITELLNMGVNIQYDRYNNFELNGVKIVQTSTGNISGIGRIRGMTAFGAYINEATLCNPEVFDEIKARCSGKGARIICDTNPDHPEHWLLKDYIRNDKAKGIVSYHFELDDNTFLDERYKNEIKQTTPKGMFYDRAIKGLWVSGKGAVYSMFDKAKHTITDEHAQKIYFERFFCGVDWGWEHWGSIIVCGVSNGKYYLLEEHAAQHKNIDQWVDIAKGIMADYGNIPFYCDTARSEHIYRFNKSGIDARYANKRVMDGIEVVSTLMGQEKFKVIYDNCPRFKQEIYNYVWNDKTGEPVKQNDDVMDAMRYAIYSDYMIHTKQTLSFENKHKLAQKFGL